MRRIRCAIYTRKSSEEGLEQAFNSLDAQREACAAYIASQTHEGWEPLPERYDDGGISGGHLDRPALQRLMRAVDAKQVDRIVVYKIDRLTRSLSDFAKLVDRLDAAGTSFVSVTQSFNAATSMGRLTLNMLLSFAQFEREVTAERIRDKIAASKRKGLWMGGNVPLGYQADDRTLKIDTSEAATISQLYDLYLAHDTILTVKARADELGLTSRRRIRAGGRVAGGTPFDRGHIHHILSNPIYAGRIRHKGQVYAGQHPAIIDPEVWGQVQRRLAAGATKARGTTRKAKPSPLAGKLFDETGDRLTPSHSRKAGKRLRYYISNRLVMGCSRKHPDAWRLPAEQLETLLGQILRQFLARPGAAVALIKNASAADLITTQNRLKDLAPTLDLIERCDLSQSVAKLSLSRERLAKALACPQDRIDPAALTFNAPFQARRRGVELKLHLGAALPEIDHTLVANIVKAQRWLAMIIDGKSFSEIAQAEGVSKRRVQDVIDLALLAPDILETIAAGEKSPALTTDYLIKTGFPAIWSKQREQVAAL